MGNVQSGKTANYTALITKAADAGYKLFIVLAGVHNSLRSQTQTRLNDEFLGYDLDRVQRVTGTEQRIGVKRLFPEHGMVYTLTSSSQNGDFNKRIASQVGIFPSSEGPPIILIIKKNVSILKNLITWISSICDEHDHKGRPHLSNIPTLIIDDECDYASINTKEPELDENGNINSEWDPTRTNLLIRRLLNIFDRCAYVGYTATPYANIFIHKDRKHPRWGDDLFPRSFIISLPTPSNYIGPERVFGLEADSDRGVEEIEALPLIRYVDDHTDIIPDRHKKTTVVAELPESMKHAIKSFLLNCAARSLRREGTPHNSMLIHVTRFTAVQGLVADLVESELQKLAARIMSGENLDDFRKIWESDFVPTTEEMSERGFADAAKHSWIDVLNQLNRTTRTVRIKVINGTARDYLDYRETELAAGVRTAAGEEVPWEEQGLNAIVIGGDKLSRGLTLDGLTVSYYLRASRMYDTLMQMGRWFGYKDGYSDLCRIYTTYELASWYRHIANATMELREEINYMASIGETPDRFGLKVRSHPGRLIVTSAGKSRNAQKIDLSYAGQRKATIIFDKNLLKNNMDALEKLIKEIERSKYTRVREKNFHWRGVSSDTVINFLHNYRIHDAAIREVKPELFARYIERQVKNNELTHWDVVLVHKEKGPGKKPTVNIGGYQVGSVYRKPDKIDAGIISVGTLINPPDDMLDFTDKETEKAKKDPDWGDKKIPAKIRTIVKKYRPKDRGLLLIYLPYCDTAGKSYGGQGEEVVAFGISFPESPTAVPIQYVVNPDVYSVDNGSQ
ncbi:MAG: Z1 domain-containing protein [Candidatus Aenigmarchaeota archaeon]|nr:Z1 domain-containing protein [Candidatus Aenigmarchaeota archaeon]